MFELGIPVLIDAVKAVREAVSEKLPDKNFTYPNKKFQRIGAALHSIYFADNGILGVLNRIAAGEKVTEKDLSDLVEFNQIEVPIWSAMNALDVGFGHTEGHSMEQYRIFHHVRDVKRSLRRNVQLAINEAVTLGTPIDIKEVSNLIVEIQKLNRVIEKVDHSLRSLR